MAARLHTLSFHPVHTPKEIAMRLDSIIFTEDECDAESESWAPLPIMFTPLNDKEWASAQASFDELDQDIPF